MGALDKLVAAQAKGNAVGKYNFIDADTLQDPDNEDVSYRLQGYDAPEISRFNEEGDPWKLGTAGAGTATSTITGLAQEQGYNNLVKTGKFDPNGREIVELHDESGRNFTTELLKSGALDATKYTKQEDLDAIAFAKLYGGKEAGVSDEFASAANEIQNAIDADTTRPIEFRKAAINEAQYAQGGQSSNLAFRKNDRDIKNNSLNPFSDAWEQGWIGAKEGAYGFLELLGDTAGLEGLQDIGEAGIARAQSQQGEYGKILTDWKDVKGFKSGVQFLGNNALMSLPYMVTTAGAAVAGTLAAPVIGGAAATALAVSAPATIYSGQVWNEMEGEKNAGVALTAGLAQAALDRLGIGIITGKFASNKAADLAVNKIMKATGVNKKAAEATLANATKAELAGYLKDSAKIAADQVAKKKLGMELLKQTSKSFVTGAAGEAVTEAGQEAIGYLAATQGSDKQFDWGELNDRLIAAAIAGGALGGGFATPGGINRALADYDAEARQFEADPNNESQSALYAADEKAERGYTPSTQENISEVHEAIRKEGSGVFISERKDTDKTVRAQRTGSEKTADTLLATPSLWRGATKNIFTPELQSRSRAARVMADMFGGNHQRIFSGANFESIKTHRVSKYINSVLPADAFYNAVAQGKRLTAAVKDGISNDYYSTIQAATDKDGNINYDAIPDGPKKQAFIQLNTQAQKLADQLHADQKKWNPELGYEKNYFSTYKALNKVAVEKNQKQFKDALIKKHGYSRTDADALVDQILNNNNVADIGEAFSVVKGGINPSSHQKRTLALAQDPEFQNFMEKDIFANIAAASKSAARFTAHREFIGENGAVVSKLLDQMQAEGVPEAEVNRVAAQLQDYLDAESGNYKRPTTAAGKKAQAIQKNIMTLMTFSGLPLATVSSLVEFMLVHKGMNKSQIFGDGKGKDGSLKTAGKEGGAVLVQGMKSVANAATRKSTPKTETAGQKQIRELGFKEQEVGAATVTGVTEVSASHQEWMKHFFNAIGLTQWTDYTRASRAAIAGDYLLDKTNIMFQYKSGKLDYTREVQEAQEALRNLGIDVDTYVALQEKVTAGIPLTPEETTTLQDNTREATYNWVNEAIALPGAANRPLIYQDPRFALFTQFQGFVSTFTANHIPKLWGEYVKRGTPAMKYNAFATMATMIMMGFLSQHIKDWLKYGDEEENYERKTGLNPYLDTAGYVRRGVQSSGLLGSAERVLNFLDPVYEDNSSGVADWTFNSAVGESPALGWVERALGAGGAFVEGDVGKGVEQSLKVAPIFGPFSLGNKLVGEAASNWNFNGES